MAGPWAIKDGLGNVVYDPFAQQVAYHTSRARYRLFGGSKGCGKSKAIRFDHHLFHLAVPGSRGLITRRLLTELKRSHIRDLPAEIQALGGEVAGFQWKPSDVGAGVLWYPERDGKRSSLEFGHVQHESDVETYLSAAYERVSQDELVTYPEYVHLMLCSCLRTTIPGIIPQFGSATNPGGKYGRWVHRRWIAQDVTPDEDEVYDVRDYHYIPALPKDNPHLNWAEYNRELSRLPPEIRAAYRDGRWDVFVGQFFPKFQRATHVLSEEEAERTYRLPRAYQRDAAMMWGSAHDGIVLWVVLAEDGTLIVEDELAFNGPRRDKLVPSEVAALALERVDERGWTMRRWLANPQLAEQRGADGGETRLQTLQRSGVPARVADDDRINGWERVQAWLRTNPKTGKPFLRVHPRCVNLIRSIGDVVQDDADEDDVDPEGPEFAVNALRFAVMGRPSPAKETPTVAYAPNTVGALLRQARREAEPKGRILGQTNQSRRRGISVR
jgi:phage terminase large subunit